jgi:hypothetical protein
MYLLFHCFRHILASAPCAFTLKIQQENGSKHQLFDEHINWKAHQQNNSKKRVLFLSFCRSIHFIALVSLHIPFMLPSDSNCVYHDYVKQSMLVVRSARNGMEWQPKNDWLSNLQWLCCCLHAPIVARLSFLCLSFPSTQ